MQYCTVIFIPKHLSLSLHLSFSLGLGNNFSLFAFFCFYSPKLPPSLPHLLSFECWWKTYLNHFALKWKQNSCQVEYLKHSSPPMPGDCLTPLVESWTLNLFPFNSAPCNSRSRSLILPRPWRKISTCCWFISPFGLLFLRIKNSDINVFQMLSLPIPASTWTKPKFLSVITSASTTRP